MNQAIIDRCKFPRSARFAWALRDVNIDDAAEKQRENAYVDAFLAGKREPLPPLPRGWRGGRELWETFLQSAAIVHARQQGFIPPLAYLVGTSQAAHDEADGFCGDRFAIHAGGNQLLGTNVPFEFPEWELFVTGTMPV